MKLTLEPTEIDDYGFPHPTITINYPNDDLSIDQIWDNMLGPALLAWGFTKETVRELRYETLEEAAKAEEEVAKDD